MSTVDLTISADPALTQLRHIITNIYRKNEAECLAPLLLDATLPAATVAQMIETAKQFVSCTREYKKKQGKIDVLLHQYDLSTDEGIALMCLAEALLRIPDKATMDKLISDKLSNADWQAHLDKKQSLFTNAATWSLFLTGKVYQAKGEEEASLLVTLRQAIQRVGMSLIRPIIVQMMTIIGKQFVMGERIDAALQRAKKSEALGYRYSYDMLGEAARTAEDATHYYNAYLEAIMAIGQVANANDPTKNPGISVKLSALHPRYEYTHREQLLEEIPPLLLVLAHQAKQYQIGLTIDAEEADRLDLSLDIFERVFAEPSLQGWDGFGIVVQGYQKRAYYVFDWLIALSKKYGRRIMVRLVKGAYWDAEIKMSQMQGFAGYPVFTRKSATDVSYLACAKKMLAHPEQIYSQFGTHNAYSAAAIIAMAGQIPFEFQCLHGMGEPLYHQIVGKYPCRIYAPVGTHRDLLGYLVRRLLENGANSSFVNSVDDDTKSIDDIIFDPVARMQQVQPKAHPKIPLPENIYRDWKNSCGIDFSNQEECRAFYAAVSAADATYTVPASATPEQIAAALDRAYSANRAWDFRGVEERAKILEAAADLFQAEFASLASILTREAGKCMIDACGEIRETIDYCRYYAYRARQDLAPVDLPGPTGEKNQLSLHPRGTMVCISPWNFPLAIFTGQILAALATGNTVLAKPAEQTPIIAQKAVEILHRAGVPTDVLQLVLGSGRVIGTQLISDPRVAGVMFTGSTQTAKTIEQTLAHRQGPIAAFIAETGGQNAMIVDASALPEQVVLDIATSAFNSAGQRCSALRVLFVQEEIAPTLLTMLQEYMKELRMGDPRLLSTDIGPVIDRKSLEMLQQHRARMLQEATLLGEVPMPSELQSGAAGHYFAPCAFEIPDLSILEGEVFGPILHVIRYPENKLDEVLTAIHHTGFGLTLGIHSRINATVAHIIKRVAVGNIYVNRNMIGAVVGVQPFGGEGLSGTGPKAGGPHYLPRLCVERTISNNITAMGGNTKLISLLEDD